VEERKPLRKKGYGFESSEQNSFLSLSILRPTLPWDCYLFH